MMKSVDDDNHDDETVGFLNAYNRATALLQMLEDSLMRQECVCVYPGQGGGIRPAFQDTHIDQSNSMFFGRLEKASAPRGNLCGAVKQQRYPLT